MDGGSRQRLIVGLALGAVASSCATVVGLTDYSLEDRDAGVLAGGPLGDGEEDAGCSGAGCACTSDPECSPPYAECVAGRCAECVLEPDSCPSGRHCRPGGDGGPNECAVGCKADPECTADAPFCNTTRHQCVACRTGSDCPADKECSPAGTCVDRCTGDGGTCADANERCCDGLCIDVTSDIFNCGVCGGACSGASPLCCSGQCKTSLTSVDACGSCSTTCKAVTATPVCAGGACVPATCADVLLTDPTARSGVFVVDPDGPGGASSFPVLCDMSTAGGGWTLVGRELPSATGTFRFLGRDTRRAAGIAQGSESGLVGRRFSGKYTEVAITWDVARYARFTVPAGFDLFSNQIATSIEVSDFSTSEPALMSWVASAGGAKVCVASRYFDARPGETSWAVKPRGDENTVCGCSGTAWEGRGAYYGGVVEQSTACDPSGGGWAGVKDHREQKGGITPPYETLIWIR